MQVRERVCVKKERKRDGNDDNINTMIQDNQPREKPTNPPGRHYPRSVSAFLEISIDFDPL